MYTHGTSLCLDLNSRTRLHMVLHKIYEIPDQLQTMVIYR